MGGSDTRMVPCPGGRVWTSVEGSGDGAPLLVLHGGPGMPHNYLLALRRLGDERRVVFYDQLGCGLSDRPDDPSLWTLERSLQEVQAVREHLGLEELHLFGSSWGGLLAIEYALDHQSGLRSLVLSSPLVSVPQWVSDAKKLRDALPAQDKVVIERHEESGRVDCPEYAAAVLTFWKRHVCRLDPWPDDLEDCLAGMGQDPYRTMWGPSEFTQTGNLAGVDPSPRLGDISTPALWTCGEHDEARPGSTKGFASRMADAEVHVFEHSSHVAHLEEPESYFPVVREFLRRFDGRRSG